MVTSKKSNSSILDGLTFDDVLLVPQKSTIIPRDAVTKAELTPSLSLNVPLISAAMDTVTQNKMAIAMALQGGIGVIHKNLSVDAQVFEVARVKKYTNIMIEKPFTVAPEMTIGEVQGLIRTHGLHYSSFPVLKDNRLVGFVGRDDTRFHSFSKKISDVMVPSSKLVTLSETDVFVKGEVDSKRLKKHFVDLFHLEKKKTLPVVSKDNKLLGVVCAKDIDHEKRSWLY